MEHLIEAVIANDSSQVEKLLRQGANPNGYEDEAKVTPLHFAAQHNSKASAELLILAGADLHAQTSDGLTPLDIAKLHRHHEMVQLLQAPIPENSQSMH